MPNHRLNRRNVLGAAFVPWLAPVNTYAQAAGAGAFPERPLRLVVPLPAGSVTDVAARPLAQKLGEALGQTVVVENRPGASGTIGVDLVAKAPPDGYTLAIATIAPLAILPHLTTLPFDPRRDLAPITKLTAGPITLVAHAGAPFDTVRQLVDRARAQPGTLKVATHGIGSFGHLVALMINGATGTDLGPVPYQGGPQMVADTIGGQVPLLLDFATVIGPHVREGKLKALAMTGARRNPLLPDVPTFEELGFKGIQAVAWQGVVAPAATPTPVLRRLSQELMRVLAAPDLRELLGRGGAEVGGDTPEDFAAFIRDEYERWGKLIRDHGVRLG